MRKHATVQDPWFILRPLCRVLGNAFAAAHVSLSIAAIDQYNIDDGPAFTGLNSVVAYYSEQPDGLARSLKNYCLLGGPAAGQEQVPGSLSKNAASLLADAGLNKPGGGTHINIIRGDQIVEGATIGSGNFGDVKIGTWNKPGSPPIPVALKTVRDVNQSPSATQEFLIEATDMVQLQNPYVHIPRRESRESRESRERERECVCV
jgi:hypothetical protein